MRFARAEGVGLPEGAARAAKRSQEAERVEDETRPAYASPPSHQTKTERNTNMKLTKADITLDSGCELSVMDLALNDDGNTIYTFTMPAAAVNVIPVFSVSTGINTLYGADFATNLNEALRNGKVFDVSGRKVSNVVKGGIYIVDGKKMIIRK